jgi:hypothetical protein
MGKIVLKKCFFSEATRRAAANSEHDQEVSIKSKKNSLQIVKTFHFPTFRAVFGAISD